MAADASRVATTMSSVREPVTHWFHIVAALCTLALCLFAGFDAGTIRPNDGTVWLLGRQDVTILEVPNRSDGAPTLLLPGDVIRGIGKTLVNSPQEAAKALGSQEIGAVVPYMIERSGDLKTIPVQLTSFRTADRFFLYYGVLAAVYWVIGLMIYLRGRRFLSARLFFRLCMLFAIFFMTNLSRSSYFWGDIITQNAGALARFLLPAIFLHFFLIFPDKKLTITRFPVIEPLLYVLPVVFYVQFTLDQFFGSHAPRIYSTRWLILGSYFSSGVVALIHSYIAVRDPIQRQRMRILTLGTLAGIMPFLVFTVLLGGRVGSEIAFLGIAPMILVPVAFAYSIARYRVMQIEVLLRRSLLYTTLTGGLLILYLGLVLALGAVLLHLSGQTSQVATIAATLLAAAALWPLRTQVQGHLDRRFFRSKGNLASALQEFGQDIPRLIKFETLIDRIGRRLCVLLDVPKVAVYRPHEDSRNASWVLAGSASTSEDAPLNPCPEILDLQATARRLAQFNEPYWVERSSTRLSMKSAATREQAELLQRLDERDLLADRGFALLVPMLAQDHLVGVFALPAKRGGDDYQIQDLELLTMVSGQVALQMENSRLYEQELKKQKLEEQLSLARSIQSRLLPGRIPDVSGVDLAATNITSAEVSGDYYDTIPMPDGRLAIIISDVSGKGVPASLLASSLQASLRAHCVGSDSPAQILTRVNLYLHESTDPSHFATLFLAVYDPVERSLNYCSGGHNPPILRRSDGRIELLEKGGMPIGAFDFSTYEEEKILFDDGDMLFLYTDGLTESLSPEGEEFGTERVEQLLDTYHELEATDLLTSMHDQLRSFLHRDQADDDVTLMVLKILQTRAANSSLLANLRNNTHTDPYGIQTPVTGAERENAP